VKDFVHRVFSIAHSLCKILSFFRSFARAKLTHIFVGNNWNSLDLWEWKIFSIWFDIPLKIFRAAALESCVVGSKLLQLECRTAPPQCLDIN
jgi:hypothetical protein